MNSLDQGPEYQLPGTPENSRSDIPGDLPVDDIFEQRGATMDLSQDEDPSIALQMFDRPEELTFKISPSGSLSLVKKEDFLFLEAREKATLEVLAEEGIDLHDLDNINKGMSLDRTFELREKIDQRVKERFPVAE